MDQVQIFISYAREDQEQAREIYRRLAEQGYKPWLDEEDLLPGQNFRLVIEKSLTGSDFVIICLSQVSVAKRSFFQREIKRALDKLEEMLPEDIFVIPARLDQCEMPEELKDRHWVNLFEERGWEKLFRALDHQLRKLGKTPPQPVAQSRASQTARQSAPEPPRQSAPKPPTPRTPVVSKKERVVFATDPALFDFVTVKVDKRGKVIDRQQGQARGLVEDLGNGVKLEMVEIPGGEFTMGSNEYGWEKPPHRVKVQPFAMGRYQVTQAQWRAVAAFPKVKIDLNPNPSRFKGDNLPVEQVSWEEAVEFCARLSQKTGKTYRLPSEAEWEYAARAGTTAPFAFGETITPEIVNYDGNYPYAAAPKGKYRGETVEVGSLGVANGFGLYDMHGNVWEWCEDHWHDSYAGAPTDGSAWVDISADGSYRVLRGGGWNILAVLCRSANRGNVAPGYRSGILGFRLLRTYR
jgi:formylglycine-generating enzyme required for sulfatase activity